MGGDLIEIVAGVLVALHQTGAVGGEAHVPADIAHLGDHLGGLGAHFLGGLPVGEGEALDGGTGGGMGLVKVLLLVDGGHPNDAGLHVHGGHHAAVVEVVHKFAAAAHPQDSGNEVDVAAPAPDGHHPGGVDGAGVQSVQRRVLLDDRLQLQPGGLLGQMAVQGIQRGEISRVQLFNAPAAAAHGGLGHEHRVALQKGQHVGFVFSRHRHPLPVEEGLKPGVEPGLVVQIAHIVLVVVFDDELVVPAPGEVGVPLLRGQVVHLEQVVVHIARAVLHRAPPHVLEHGPAGAARFFVDGADLVQHGLVVHVQQPLDQEFHLSHGNLPLPFLVEKAGKKNLLFADGLERTLIRPKPVT